MWTRLEGQRKVKQRNGLGVQLVQPSPRYASMHQCQGEPQQTRLVSFMGVRESLEGDLRGLRVGEDRGDHCKGGSPPWELLREMGPEVSPVSPGGSPWTSSDSLKVARRGACRRWLLISACLPAAQCAFRPAVHLRLQVGARASAGGTYEWDYGHLPEAQLGTREAICKCLMVIKAHGMAAHVPLESGATHVLPEFANLTGFRWRSGTRWIGG